jgi:hypothetical protein
MDQSTRHAQDTVRDRRSAAETDSTWAVEQHHQSRGEDPVVAFDFAVVTWGVGGDPLVAGSAHDGGEVFGAIAGAVVGDQAVDVGDDVTGEERPRAVDESDRGPGGLVGQRFGVGQAGVAVDGGVQVGVAARPPRFLPRATKLS